MERETAVRLLAAIDAMAPQFDEITLLTDEIADEAECRAFRETLANALQLLGYDLVMRIVRQYPDLDPDKEYFARRQSVRDP